MFVHIRTIDAFAHVNSLQELEQSYNQIQHVSAPFKHAIRFNSFLTHRSVTCRTPCTVTPPLCINVIYHHYIKFIIVFLSILIHILCMLYKYALLFKGKHGARKVHTTEAREWVRAANLLDADGEASFYTPLHGKYDELSWSTCALSRLDGSHCPNIHL